MDPAGPQLGAIERKPDPATNGDAPPHGWLVRVPATTIDAVMQSTLASLREATSEAARVLWHAAGRLAESTPGGTMVLGLSGAVEPHAHDGDDGDGADSPLHDWRTRLADAESALAVAMHRATELEERCDRTVHDLLHAREREQALRTELSMVLERGCAEREAISRRADQLVAVVEEQRAAAAREAEAVRAALAAAQHASLALRNELSLARSDAARHAASAEEARQAREQLETEGGALRSRIGELQETVHTFDLEIARTTEERRRAEVVGQSESAEREARWHEQLSTMQTAHARELDRAQALADEVTRQRAELETLERREQRLRDELLSVAARADTDREDTVRRAQEMVQAAEQARAAATAELESLRATLAGDRARLLQMEAEHERAEQGAAEQEAALASVRTVVDRLEQSRAATVADLERARASLAQSEGELLAARHEFGLAHRQLDRLCTAHDDLVEDHARLTAVHEQTRARENELRERTDVLREQVRSLEVERARLLEVERQHAEENASHDQLAARAADGEAELERQRERVRVLEEDLVRATASLEQASARERRTRDDLDDAMRVATEHESMLSEARALAEVAERERATVAAEVEALRTAMASSQRMILEAEDEARTARTEVERLAVEHEARLAERQRAEVQPGPSRAAEPAVSEPASTGHPSPSTPSVDLDGRKILILDAVAEWPPCPGIETQVLPPDRPVLARVQEFGPGRCLVNLAAPGAIAAAAVIRTKGPAIPFWGCILAADGERGIGLGAFDVLSRPIEPDVVRARIARIAPKTVRVLAIGSDSATFIGLRQRLMKTGLSVSIAWDVKQAVELLALVRPHVVVLDLALPPRGTAPLVIELAQDETPPALALIPASDETLAAFAKAVGGGLTENNARSRANLLRAAAEANLLG
jgi:chromosome segregation ATPase